MPNNTLLEVKDLKMYFENKKGFLGKKIEYVKAVDGVSFKIQKGETIGLVGESGCGKSTTGYSIMRLYKPTAGEIIFDGKDIAQLSAAEVWPYRKRMQMIFQDPYASLNPRMTVGEIIKEPMKIFNIYDTDEEREARVRELLDIGSLKPDHIRRYPAEFSGGQRQRIGIARALAVNPKFIVCDEPISALDVSVQAQIVNLLKKLQKERNISYLFIAHDLAMVKYISDRIAVMYMGSIVEIAEAEALYDHAYHPYTQLLISTIPIPDPEVEENRKDEFSDFGLISEFTCCGCRFADRCKESKDICYKEKPKLKQIVSGHFVACHLYW